MNVLERSDDLTSLGGDWNWNATRRLPVLTDENWEEVQTTFKKETGLETPARFREVLNLALQTFVVSRDSFHDGTLNPRNNSLPARPKVIRKNLRGARELALRLVDRLNCMDGNSKQLIDEAGGIRFLELYELLDRFLDDHRRCRDTGEGLSRK